jgi:hypothetical protein
MKTQIDIKSALLGIVVGVLAVLAVGAGTASNEVGRYQVSTAASISILLDSKTGQAWVYVLPGVGGRNDNATFFDAK